MRARGTLLLAALTIGVAVYIAMEESGDGVKPRGARFLAAPFGPADVDQIGIATDNFGLLLRNEAGHWALQEPTRARADQSRVEQLLAALFSAPPIDRVAGRATPEQAAEYGLSPARWTITVTSNDRKVRMAIGRPLPGGQALYASVEDGEVVSLPVQPLSGLLPAAPEDFRERRLLVASAADVGRIDVQRAQGFLQLSRDEEDDRWEINAPFRWPARHDAMTALLDSLMGVRAASFEATTLAAATLYGLDEPAVRCTVLTRHGHAEESLLLGSVHRADSNRIYAAIKGRDEIYSVDRAVMDLLTCPADALRDGTLPLPDPEQLSHIAFARGEQSLAFSRDTNGVWWMEVPRRLQAEEAEMAKLIATWATARVVALRAAGSNEVAAGAAKDTSIQFGLAPASTDLVLFAHAAAGGGLEANLPERGLCAALADDPLALLDWSGAAYRNRHVMPIDPLSVVSLSVTATGYAESVSCDPTTRVWVAASGTNKVAGGAVTNILNTLQWLRAVRFVSDPSGGMAAYGLEPPSATLLFQTIDPPASRSLLLGRQAPDGFFAAVQGAEGIFVVPPAAATNLWRRMLE